MYQNNQQVTMINIDDILPNRFQPRLKFNEEEILNLAESIKEHGVIQPIVVRRLGDRYELIAGERRTKASAMAGKKTIPAIIVDLNDSQSAEVALIENVQRQDLTSIEEAVSYRKILDMGYLNQSQLAEKVGKKQSTIANKLRLLTLPKEVQTALLETKISERHARSLLRLENSEKQIHMLDRIINERLTVRKTDQEIDKIIDLSKMEILDVSFLEKKEEDKMDNKFNFDDMIIPTTSIINDNNTSDINEVINPVENNANTFNPGFMDIDKIADQAQDIKQENVSFNVSPEQIIPSIPQEPKKEEIPTPKFFNILDSAKPAEPIEQPVIEETKGEPEISTSIFDFSMPKTENITEVKTDTIELQPSEEQEVIEETVVIPEEQSAVIDVSTVGENNNPTINTDIDDIAIIDDNNFGVEEDIIVEQNNEQTMSKPPLREVISKIRELSTTINGMNYVVDIEEMDLENIYQVVIKIQK